MAAERPALSDLDLVADGESVVRLVGPHSWNSDAPEGFRLEDSNLPSTEWKKMPSATNYGPSCFVVARLPTSMREVVAVHLSPKQRAYGWAVMTVKELRELGIEVRYSPQDCEIEALRPAHATLCGITKSNRPLVIAALEKNMLQLPLKREGA